MVENRLHRAIKLKNLKKIIILIFVVFSVNTIMAQTLSSGNYSSSDLGYTYTVSVKHEGNIITITESNRVNQYKSNGGNTYYHIEQKLQAINIMPENREAVNKYLLIRAAKQIRKKLCLRE